jgi:hypothetical protein
MKTLVLGLCVVGLVSLSGSARAQCGCSATANMSYAPTVHSPMVLQQARPSTVVAPRRFHRRRLVASLTSIV